MVTPNQIANDPHEFARVFLKILDKEKNLVPFRWNKAQKDFHYKRTGRDLILKARHLGFSTIVQGEIFRRAVTKTSTSLTLAHDDTLTSKLRIMSDLFYENCSFNGIQPQRKYANSSLATYPEFNSSCIIGKAGSVNIGRGDTYTDIHGTEVAFWKDAEKIMVGAMQGGSPDVILESTPNGAQGYFYKLCMEALTGQSIWKLHFYPWWWDESYAIPLEKDEQIKYTPEEAELVKKHSLTAQQIKWRRYKIMEIRDKFMQEYPEDPITCFLTSGNSYFGDLRDVFTAPMDVKYNPEHEYFAGLDWGQSSDYTAMPVLDATAKQQVDLLHINKLSWKTQRDRIKGMYSKWHVKGMGVEMNSIGSVNFEALHDDGLNVIPFDTTNETKADIMSALYESIHTHGWKLQDHPVLRHEMNTFVSKQLPSGIWRLEADGEGHDDTVMGLAIAKWAVQASKMQLF